MEDNELQRTVERARDHDPDAWEALYRHSYPRLHAYARRRLGGAEHADDVVSEAFARALVAIGRFRWTAAGFDGWIFGIMLNVLSEQFRSDRRDGSGRAFAADEPDPADDEPGALEQVLISERDAELRRALDKLPVKEREILELRVIGGLDAPAIAEIIGKRPGAVRMAQSRALRRLHGLLAGVV